MSALCSVPVVHVKFEIDVIGRPTPAHDAAVAIPH
jgi:hypothetical protein